MSLSNGTRHILNLSFLKVFSNCFCLNKIWHVLKPELDCQSRLIAARDQVPSPADYNAVISNLEKVTVDLGAIFESHGIDLIVVLTDSRISSLASASASGRSYNNPQEYPLDWLNLGFPIGTMPLGYIDYNGKPFGLAVVGNSGKMVGFSNSWVLLRRSFPKEIILNHWSNNWPGIKCPRRAGCIRAAKPKKEAKLTRLYATKYATWDRTLSLDTASLYLGITTVSGPVASFNLYTNRNE